VAIGLHVVQITTLQNVVRSPEHGFLWSGDASYSQDFKPARSSSSSERWLS